MYMKIFKSKKILAFFVLFGVLFGGYFSIDSVYEKIKTLKERIQNQITQLEEMKENILDEMFNHDETK